MSRLEDLINKLCPDGVEYIKLKECSLMERGTSITKDKIEEGNIPVVSGGRKPAYCCNSHNRDGETITIAGSGAGAGYVAFWNIPIFVCDAFSVKGTELSNTKYLFYCLTNLQQRIYETQKGGGVPHVHISSIENFEIPLPPLDIQNEIVKILDNFTELETKLETELESRIKQYEYYRDKLLTFGDEVERKPFGEVSTIVRGASPRPIQNFITEDEDGVNWVKIGDVPVGSKYVYKTEQKITKEGAFKSRFVKEGDFILSNSMSFGRPYIMKTSGCIHDGWLSISNFENYYTTDFLYHLLNSSSIQNEMRRRASFGGAVQNLNADIVRELVLPIPPLAEQERIVAILDKFDALCNDITQGLPAEIEKRHKQYEYYRDKLLSFKRKV